MQQVVKGAPRVCGDDPTDDLSNLSSDDVLPAYAGMIPVRDLPHITEPPCSPRMRG